MKKKFKIKLLELTIDMLVAVIAEMTIEKAFAKIPIPSYSIGQAYDKSDLKIPDYKQNSTGEKITCDDSQPFGFAPIENDFQKGMLEADKELQRICKQPIVFALEPVKLKDAIKYIESNYIIPYGKTGVVFLYEENGIIKEIFKEGWPSRKF